MRPTVLEVNLNAIKENLDCVKRCVPNKRIYAVVKADAYGLGIIEVTKTLIEKGVNHFAVALIEEAQILRQNEIKENILLLSPFFERDIPRLFHYAVTPTLIDFPRAKALNDYAYKQNQKIQVHVKVDTGMGRLGVQLKDAYQLIEKILDLKSIEIEGIYSHFPSADIPDREFTLFQISSFSKFIDHCRTLLTKPFTAHLSNSSGIIAFPEGHFDAVRPGLMLYGVYPSPYIQSRIKLSKVIEFKSQIASIKSIDKGDSVSYGRTFRAKDKMKIAVVPAGYADGLSTLLSNKGEFLVQNRKVPIIGRVCMDYTIIDVSSLNDLEVGEEVCLIGKGITEEDIAQKTGLIPYEILTNISKRVPRIYI